MLETAIKDVGRPLNGLDETDRRPRDIDATRRKVLAELARPQIALEHRGPAFEVLGRVGVEGLLEPTVIDLVGLVIADKPKRSDADRAADAALVDCADRRLARDRARLSDVDRDHRRHGTTPCLLSERSTARR